MPNLGVILRRLFALCGYQLTRREPGVAISLSTYLRGIRSRAAPISVVCFDNEILIQSEILEVFPAEGAFFSCPLFDPDSGILPLDSIPIIAPSGRFIAIADVEMLAIEVALGKFPWLQHAEALIIKTRFGAFWSEKLDVCSLDVLLRSLGFSLADVVDFPRLSYPQAPAARALLAYERPTVGFPRFTGSRYRVNEAVTYLSAPIVRQSDFRLLAGRGSFGFEAGVHNPGAIVENGRAYLLPRADRTPWAFQKADESLFFTSSQPLLLTLGDDHRVASAVELSTVGLPNPQGSRTGDFRLFKFGGRIFTNHFVMSSPRQPVARRRLKIDDLQTRVGVSELSIEKRELAWHGFPALDRPLSQAEKNWAMFTDGRRLFLLYSFAPYVLLVADNWPGLTFSTIIDLRIEFPFGGDGLPLRNSINPVDYDDAHWLHIVHKVYPSKQYAFWAVLIDKQTLRPVRVTARPLVRGWQSYPASIIYTCSVIVGPTDVFLFSGLDDAATAVAKVPRSRLDAEWIQVAT